MGARKKLLPALGVSVSLPLWLPLMWVCLACHFSGCAWQYLSLHEAESYLDWQLAHCANYALKSEGAVCRVQKSSGGRWEACPQIAEGTSEIAWDVRCYPGRLEILFPHERTISAFAWWRFLNRGSDAYGPGNYSIEVSVDGERWEPVVEKVKNPWLGRNIHCFPQVEAKAIALVLLAPLMPAYPRTILLKAGVYNLADVKSGSSVQDPPWFSDTYGYRARISEPQALDGNQDLPVSLPSRDLRPPSSLIAGSREGERGPSLSGELGAQRASNDRGLFPRRWADLTALVGERYRQVPDPNSVTVVDCFAGPTQLLQQECATAFMPDARFDPAKEAVGTLVWWNRRGAQPDEGSQWVYLNAGTNQTPLGQDLLPAGVAISVGAREATVQEDNQTTRLSVVDDLAQLVGDSQGAGLRLSGLDPLRRYCVVRREANGQERAAWFHQPVAPAIYGKVSLPLYNYRRGMILPFRITVQNSLNAPVSGRVIAAVMDEHREVRREEFEVSLGAKSGQELKWAVDTSALASKQYRVECRMVSATNVCWAASASFEVVPQRNPGLLFGLYGLPRDSRMQVIRYLEDAQKHNVTLDNGHYNGANSALYFDMAAVYGVNLAPCAHENLWPYSLPKGAVPQQAETGASSDWPCFRDPTTREWARRNLQGVLTNLCQYPAFCDRIGFHDDVALRTVSVGEEKFLTCYCPLCREAFKRETGVEPPVRTKVKWSSAIIEDDDPWLRWNIFRVRDCYADFTKSLSEAIGRTAPQVKLGSFVVKNLNPEAGLYAYYHMAPCGAVSCYDYPRATGTDANAFFMRQSGIMGNRQKESWMLNWIGGDPSLAMGTDTASPGEVRCQFWNMLAAGNHIISFFRYGEPGTKECIEGTAALEELGRVGAIARKVGPLFLVARPAAAKVAVLCSFTDYSGSLLSNIDGWWNVRAALRNAFSAAFEEHLSPEILAEEELITGRVENYQVIIVPNIRFIRKAALAELENQAAKGKLIVISANSPVSTRGAVRSSTSQEMAQLARKTIGALPLDPHSSQVTVQHFVAAGLTMFVLVNQIPGADRIKTRYAKAKPVALAATVSNTKAAYYDLLEGKALSLTGENVAINLPAAGGGIIVAYDEPVSAVQIELKKSVVQGDAQELSLKVKTKAGKVSAGTHLLEVVVSNAEGKSAEYSQRVVAERGAATVSIPIAINDPVGPWKVAVREAASSVSAVASFNVLAKNTGR